MDFPIHIELTNNLNKIIRISATLKVNVIEGYEVDQESLDDFNNQIEHLGTKILEHKPVRVCIADGGSYIIIKLAEMLKSQNILVLVETKWVYLPI